MKPIYLHILAAIAAMLTVTACGNEDIEPATGDVAVDFTATIKGGSSRMTGSQWEAGDEIAISTNYSAAANNFYNMCYVTPTGDGVFHEKTPADKIYFRSASHIASVTYLAFYPYKYIENPAVTNNRNIEVTTTDQTNQKSLDILFAKATATKDSPVVNLEFNHRMTQVTFVFRNGKDFDVSDIVSYKLGNLYMTAKLSLSSTTGSFTSLSNINSVTMELHDVKAGKPLAPLLFIPQSVPGGTSTTTLRPVTLEIKDRKNVTYKVDLTFPKNQLVAGTNYLFTITVNKTGLVVNNCSIENWIDKEDTGWGSGTAGSADDPDEQ